MFRFVSPEPADLLEAEPLLTNAQLLGFEVRSRTVSWDRHVVPLVPRAAPVYLQRDFQLMSNTRVPCDEHNKREVLVCHDMMGNYLEDRHFNNSKKFDDYRFYHWAGIDYFCYFSHKYITIPPPGWTCAAHQNGVPVLGTYIVEDTNGSRLLHQVLSSKQIVEDTVRAMTKVCKHFCFDGWLVNIECDVKPESMENLYYFLELLRKTTTEELRHGKVIWYDSVIDTGKVHWQDELNEKNVRFFKQSDVMLLNYCWKDSSFEVTQEMCEKDKIPRSRIFFGIDVFGRCQIAKFQTKNTLQRVVERNFSTGIFAPAWTFETLQTYGYNIKDPLGLDVVNEAFLQRNDKWWTSLWDSVATHPYNYLPFYSSFCLGSGKAMHRYGLPISSSQHNPGRFFQLKCQSVQPSVGLHGCVERYYNDAFNGGSCLHIIRHDIPFRLFAFDTYVPAYGLLIICYAFKLKPEDGEIDCVLRFCDASNASNVDNSLDCYLFCGDYNNTQTFQRGRCYISPIKPQHLPPALDTMQIPKDLPTNVPLSKWYTRYYALCFDTAICLRDFGVLYRPSIPQANNERMGQDKRKALLGAINVNRFNPRRYVFTNDEVTNYATIPVKTDHLFNSSK